MSTLATDDTIERARRPLMDSLAQAFALYGWPEVTGRIYGLLYLEARPMSQQELSERLDVSKATVSTNLRSLEVLHMVHRVGGPESGGDRSGGRPRLYLQAERDFMKVVQELIRHNARREIEVMERGLEESRLRLLDLTAQPGPIADQALADLNSIKRFEGYKRWGKGILWTVQSVGRMQRFIASFRRGDEAQEHTS